MKRPPYIKRFKNLEQFDDWIFDMQERGINPHFKPVAKNTFKIIRHERLPYGRTG